MLEAAFKYTVPIQKALEREDGALILVGLASGPEVDGDGERVTQEAIWSMAKQINEGQDIPLTQRVPYVDAHAKDGVLRELGHVIKAWVTDSGYLGVEVELDPENPAAIYLHKQIKKGKQFGMSVAGKVTDWAMEYAPEIGKSVRTFKNVILREISNTTRPSWSHSLGTVIAKAISDAEDDQSDAAVGENVEDELQTEQETTETPAVNDTPEEQPVEAAAEDAAVTEESPSEAEAAPEETVAEAAAEVVDEAVAAAAETEEPAAVGDTSTQFREMLVGLTNYMGQMLTTMGVQPVMVAKSVSQDENEPTIDIAKAIDDATAPLRQQVEELQKSLTQATARIEELENSPAGDDSPGLVEKHALTEQDIEKAIREMSPRDRIRLGLRAQYERE